MVLPNEWLLFRDSIRQNGRVLTGQILESAYDLYAKSAVPIESLTGEYSKEEFLLVVDQDGRANGCETRILEQFRQLVEANPSFERWFREGALPPPDQAPDQPGVPVLLAARWLCHLAGLRHQTVEIFLDPPHLDGHTFVQMRSLAKVEAPGALDIPCAGHVSETDEALLSLAKELAEELNLSLSDLDRLHEVCRYISPARENAVLLNEEYRFLYRARLKEESVKRIRFTDGEVAALALFGVDELRAYCVRYPERVASGLGDAILYL